MRMSYIHTVYIQVWYIVVPLCEPMEEGCVKTCFTAIGILVCRSRFQVESHRTEMCRDLFHSNWCGAIGFLHVISFTINCNMLVYTIIAIMPTICTII